MFLTDLSAAVASSPLQSTQDPGWPHRGHGDMAPPVGIICHQLGASGPDAWVAARDGTDEEPGPWAHLVLERDGSVRIIAGAQVLHAGTGDWPSIGRNVGNSYTISITAVYDGTDLTAAQRRCWPWLAAILCHHYKIPVGNVIGHGEWTSRVGDEPAQIDMAAFRAAVQTLLNGDIPSPPGPPKATEVVNNGVPD